MPWLVSADLEKSAYTSTECNVNFVECPVYTLSILFNEKSILE